MSLIDSYAGTSYRHERPLSWKYSKTLAEITKMLVLDDETGSGDVSQATREPALLGRGTSSPPQLGQLCSISSLQAVQKVHS